MTLFFSFQMATTQVYHVSTQGSDSNDGSENAPWRTIQYAMYEVTPGSEVYIHEGVYNERLYVTNSGSPGKDILFSNYGEERVVIDGTGFDNTSIIEMYHVEHIHLRGLEIRNNVQLDAIGVLVEGRCNNITLENLEVYNIHFSSDPNANINSSTNSQPIIVYGSEPDHPITDLRIIGCTVRDSRTGYSEALAVNGNVDGFEIRDNRVHDISNIGIDIIGHEGTCPDPALDQARNGIIANNVTYNCISPYASSAGIYVDGGKDLLIERNMVYNNQWGIEIGCENKGKSTSNIIVRNNLVYGNQTAGLHVGGYSYPGGSGKVTDVVIVHNTFYNNDLEDDYTGEFYMSYIESAIIQNNIFCSENTTGYMMATELEADNSKDILMSNNCWYNSLGQGQEEFYFNGVEYTGLDDFANATGHGQGSMNKDPQFMKYGNTPDLHLSNASELLSAGVQLDAEIAGSSDIDGDARSQGAGPEIGADEFDITSGVLEIRAIDGILYPQPATEGVFLQLNDPAHANEVVLTGSNGVEYLRQVISGNVTKLDLRSVPSGVFTVRVTHADGSSTIAKGVKIQG